MGSTRPLAIGCLLLAAVLAGCLAGEQRPTNATEPTSDLGEALGFETRPMNGTPGTGNWSLLEVDASTNGSLAGAVLTVPEGAEVEAPRLEGFTAHFLEVVPLVPESDRDAVESWSVMAFPELHDDEVVISGVISTGYETRYRTTPLVQEEESFDPTVEPVRLGFGDLEAGDELPIVLAVETSRPVDAGVAVRFSEDWPDDPMDDDLGDAIEDVTEQETLPEIAPTGTGSGFEIGLYLDYNEDGLFGIEAWTDSVDVSYELPVDPRPTASDRNLLLDYRFESDQGWGYGIGYEASEVEAIDWSIAADLHGTSVQAEGETVSAEVSSAIVTGYPVYLALGDGEGGTTARMEMNGASSGRIQILAMTHIDLGATLQELIGEDSPTLTFTYDGLVAEEDTTRVAVADDGLRIENARSDLSVLGPWDRLGSGSGPS